MAFFPAVLANLSRKADYKYNGRDQFYWKTILNQAADELDEEEKLNGYTRFSTR